MRLSEALEINRSPVSDSAHERDVHLICGFTPLHLETFVNARARLRFPGDTVRVHTGLFGDLEGNLARAAESPSDAAVVVLEWSDLDQRLGLRASAGWGANVLDDVLIQVEERCRRLEGLLASLSCTMPVALVAPTLPFAPVALPVPSRASAFELRLRLTLAAFLDRVGAFDTVHQISESALAACSPSSARHDVALELHAGFPYTLAHADAIANLSVECAWPAAPRKGLITDLDETLWKGILGDAGTEGISWSLDTGAQTHALYQQLLSSLADSGVLIGVASKNDPALVAQAFGRADILLKPAQIFPIEAGWGPKSEAVGRILDAWNIGADSVIFIDDNPMELGEVSERYPDMECIRFRAGKPAEVLDLLHRLRARFGKDKVRDEDRLRSQSLRASRAIAEARSTEAPAEFLRKLDARVTLEFSKDAGDGRALELINKTNQFNLNGRRFTETEWAAYLRRPDAMTIAVTYEDRFGPLGKIAVMAAVPHGELLEVDAWVMSCRAFSRHIEFQLLRTLYRSLAAASIRFRFTPTSRNGPLQDFFGRFFPGALTEEPLDLSVAAFDSVCPPLFHQVTEQWTTQQTSLRDASR